MAVPLRRLPGDRLRRHRARRRHQPHPTPRAHPRFRRLDPGRDRSPDDHPLPGPIASLEAAFIATEPHPDARFLLSFQPGHEFFSLRALKPQTAATLNVVWNRRTYVLELHASDQPWLAVNFEQPVSLTASNPPRPVAPARLLGLLDTARAYPLLKQQHPAAVAGVQCVRPQTVQDCGDYAIRIEEVFRFDAEDTLVFRVALTNRTTEPILYLPQGLMVRAGQRLYFQSATDANGLIPRKPRCPLTSPSPAARMVRTTISRPATSSPSCSAASPNPQPASAAALSAPDPAGPPANIAGAQPSPGHMASGAALYAPYRPSPAQPPGIRSPATPAAPHPALAGRPPGNPNTVFVPTLRPAPRRRRF
ncbi:MAG: hypothetical protein M5U12_12620 [Verrucomicrobia bacterium]|nr:hypothetical protein [Verrucomicrobiota bacterium]